MAGTITMISIMVIISKISAEQCVKITNDETQINDLFTYLPLALETMQTMTSYKFENKQDYNKAVLICKEIEMGLIEIKTKKDIKKLKDKNVQKVWVSTEVIPKTKARVYLESKRLLP